MFTDVDDDIADCFIRATMHNANKLKIVEYNNSFIEDFFRLSLCLELA